MAATVGLRVSETMCRVPCPSLWKGMQATISRRFLAFLCRGNGRAFGADQTLIPNRSLAEPRLRSVPIPGVGQYDDDRAVDIVAGSDFQCGGNGRAAGSANQKTFFAPKASSDVKASGIFHAHRFVDHAEIQVRLALAAANALDEIGRIMIRMARIN